MTASADTNPSLGLKLQTFWMQTGLLGIILAVNLCILLNLFGSRIYVLVAYASLRLLTPGGLWGSGKTPQGGCWRRFSEDWFYPAEIMRRYLDLSFAQPLPPEFVRAEAQTDSQFVFCAFPHGCNSDFRALMDGILAQVMPNLIQRDAVRTLAASILFKIPIVREITLWTGCIDASRKYAELALTKQKSLLIVPGGEQEQIRTTYGREKVYLSQRKGFIKLAMRKGVPVVPIYVFGVSDSYYTFHPTNHEDGKKFDWSFYNLRYKLMKNFGICITICTGLWGNPLCPLPKKTTIVFGKPIFFEPTTPSDKDSTDDSNSNPTSRGFEPTKEELDEGHALFVKELTALFDSHKGRLGYGDRTLEII